MMDPEANEAPTRAAYGKPKLYRRCRCHKWMVIAQLDENDEKLLLCSKEMKPIAASETYISTSLSDEEVVPKPEPPVQRGCIIE